MVNDSIGRYKNLFRHIQNWQGYFLRKLKKGFQPMEFVTRGHHRKFIVPSKALYLVFKEIFVTDFYDIDQVVLSLPPNPVIIDIGANAGYFDIALFSKIKEATVYAYEPIASNYELFRKNIALNAGLEKNIHLHNKAVTGTPQENIELYMEAASDNSVIASVYTDFDAQNQHIIRVPAISLMQILEQNNIEKVDLLKMDCEGSEYPIIYETPAAAWTKIQQLTVEVHNLDDDKRNVDALRQFLEEKQFSVTTEFAHASCYALTAVKKNA
ncbi:MAG: FkbM family methyltransferase [Bacteroidota bacterium]|nr:FkbM family methyltransferase [Bacteroidota bacterium]